MWSSIKLWTMLGVASLVCGACSPPKGAPRPIKAGTKKAAKVKQAASKPLPLHQADGSLYVDAAMDAADPPPAQTEGIDDPPVHLPPAISKLRVALPWADHGYVLLDMAHQVRAGRDIVYPDDVHFANIWTASGVRIPHLMWQQKGPLLTCSALLPNRLLLKGAAIADRSAVHLQFWLRNGTGAPLSDVVVQQCLQLQKARGFNTHDTSDTFFDPPYAARRSRVDNHWVIMAWTGCERAWADPGFPCLHSDPSLGSLALAETKQVIGWLSFYDGTDIQGEIRRIEATGWRRKTLPVVPGIKLETSR